MLVGKARVAHPSGFHGLFESSMLWLVLEVGGRIAEWFPIIAMWWGLRGLLVLNGALPVRVVFLRIVAVWVVKDVGQQAGFLQQGLCRLLLFMRSRPRHMAGKAPTGGEVYRLGVNLLKRLAR